MIELTEQQRKELDQETPLARDPATNGTYVLVRADLYRQMRAILDGFSRRAGWDDPALNIYEQYRKQP